VLFAREGADVVVTARRAHDLARLVEEIWGMGRGAAAVPGDARNAATHLAAVEEAVSTFGGLHIAFNNVGTVGRLKPVAELSPDEWSEVISTNLDSAFLATRAQIPAMLESGGGAIVYTSSFVGNSVGLPGMGAYAASKAGLIGLVRGVTADYGARGIRANALLPGGTATAMAGDQTQREWASSLHAMKRIADPDEIAQAALFLASDRASFVSGSSLWVDGGNAAVKM
jgi:NAD(P)-dependent dehydrogenase (short-subunit alcohol dehydrogenase family)